MKLSLKILIGIGLFAIALWAIVWLASPAVTRMVLGDVLKSQNVLLDEKSSLRLNLFRSRLTIENLLWRRNEQLSFRLNELEVRYSLFKLAFKTVHIYSVKLKGLETQANIDDNGISIAGLDLPESTETNAEKPPDSAENGLTIQIPEIILEDIAFNILHKGAAHKIKINQLTLDRTIFKDDILDSRINLDADINGAALVVSAAVQYIPTGANATISFSLKNLQPGYYHYLLPDNIEILNANIGLETELALSFINNALDVKTQSLQLHISDFAYKDQLINSQLGQLQLNAPRVNVMIEGEGNTNLELNLSTEVSGVELTDLQGQGKLTALEKLSLSDASISLHHNTLKFDAKQLALQNLLLSERKQGDSPARPPLTTVASIVIDNIIFSENDLSVDTIALGEIIATIIRDNKGDIATLIPFAETEKESTSALKTQPENENTGTPAETEITATDSQEAPFYFRLNRLNLDKKSTIHISDKKVSPEFIKTFYITELSLANINNRDIETKTQVKLRASDDEYFKYALDVAIQPFKKALNFDIQSKSSELSLYKISPYIEDALGFEIEAGQFDSTFNGKVVDSMLKGTAEATLRGAKFGSGGKTEAEEDSVDVIGQTAIPLNVALNMLKDDKGNIDLRIPVDGDVTDPNFGIHHILGLVVKKAVMSQAKSYLVNTFVPYAQVVTVAMAAGSYALKVRFEDLIYSPAQTSPAQEQQVFIQQFVTLMKDKPDLQVRICPISTAEDIALPLGTKLTPEQTAQLSDFAVTRAAEFKKQVVELGIESARLLLCTPEIDKSKESKPRLTLSI